MLVLCIGMSDSLLTKELFAKDEIEGIQSV